MFIHSFNKNALSISSELIPVLGTWGLPRWHLWERNPPAYAGDPRDTGYIPKSGRSSGEGNGNPLLFLPGKSRGQGSLAGYSPRGHKEADMTKHLSAHAHTRYLEPSSNQSRKIPSLIGLIFC